MKITIAQLNFTVGDLCGNYQKILKAREAAVSEDADLIIFSELSVTGYPPEDLVLKEDFYTSAMRMVKKLAKITSDGKTAILIGSPWVSEVRGQGAGDRGQGTTNRCKLYNSILLLADGEIQATQDKYDLPNYGVFDEKRVFASGSLPKPILFKGIKLGVMICEDMWNMKVIGALRDSDILVSMNASPFEIEKHAKRVDRASGNIKRTGLPLIYINQVCGHDDLVFDGDSFIMSAECDLLCRLPRFEEALVTTDWYKSEDKWFCDTQLEAKNMSLEERIYEAMKLALYDYVIKNGFPGVIIGMSGGIDSALSAAVAVDALGADKVRLVMMPSRYTSQESLNDAAECADAIGVELENIPIEDIYFAYETALAPSFADCNMDITEENLQSRVRGMLLMALSNKFGYMVLSTGNKSEMAVGYATLYGDMCGGYNILKDIYKMQVFTLARWRNTISYVIPENIIIKPPTAELRHDQKDEDSLPPYEILDDILQQLIEDERSIAQIVEAGHDRKVVEKVRNMLYQTEYKRRQSPLGVKISEKPFSRDRRYPITNGFKG